MAARTPTFLVIFAVLVLTRGADAAPTTDAPIDDQANVLAAADVASLTDELRGLRRDGVEMAVIVVKSTNGTPIETYAHDAGVAWSTGRTGAAVLVLAIADRKSRLEVDDKLRVKFPDSRSQRILDSARGSLRAGDYAAAIRGIVLDVRSVALGAETPDGVTATPAPSSSSGSRSSGSSNAGAIVGVIVGIGVLLGIGALVAMAKRSRQVSLSGQGTASLSPFWVDMLIGAAQALGFLFVILAIFASSSSSGSSSSSSFSSGGSSGGSSSGGGWSGGGASSGW